MLVYASDQAGEAMEKKSEVSAWTRIYLILLVTPEVVICRGSSVNSEYAPDSTMEVLCLFMVIRMVSAD
jgi:hypothetical protein